MVAIVYLARDLTSGKEYVGFSSKTLAKRRRQHEQAARLGYGGCLLLRRAMAQRGVDNFEWSLLAETSTEAEALALEQHYISIKGTLHPGGYNLTAGGERVVYSDESRARMSEGQRRARELDPTINTRIGETKRLRYAAEPQLRTLVSERMTEMWSCPAMRAQQSETRKAYFADPANRAANSAGQRRYYATTGVAALEKNAASQRHLTVAQAANVLMMHALGATSESIAQHLGVTRSVTGRIIRLDGQWRAAIDAFLTPP